jgi:hypothetical protein
VLELSSVNACGPLACSHLRYLLVDTLGPLWGLTVLPAEVHDRDGAKALLSRLAELPRLAALCADGAYAAVVGWVPEQFGWVVTTIRGPLGVRGYLRLPKRWIMERTFGWFGRYRRMSKPIFPRWPSPWPRFRCQGWILTLESAIARIFPKKSCLHPFRRCLDPPHKTLLPCSSPEIDPHSAP